MNLTPGRLFGMLMAASLLVGCATAQTQVVSSGESLGDYARTARKDKKPNTAKHYDNDNLPVNDKLSIVGATPATPEASPTPAAVPADGTQPAAAPAPDADKKPGTSMQDRQKANDQWKQKISAQKDHIDLLSRELDVAEREYRLRAAAFYADAGNRLRNSGAWDKEDANYKDQIAQKKKAVDDARQQLDDMQEQARKAGVPSSVRE
jgi:hypothetical protein